MDLKENLQSQLYEIEALQSMFYNPGELKIEDALILRDIQNFLDNKTKALPQFLDLTINLLIENFKFELNINLSHEYPEVEPDIYIRNHELNKLQHANLNKELNNFIKSLKGEPCIFSAVTWLQDNALNYLEVRQEVEKGEKGRKNDENLIRYWIYSHHIYSKTKRREIVNLAETLNITGFSMPGKPGVICVEGRTSDCNEWWQCIKSMNWKRIFCKITEECKGEKDFLRFKKFEEVVFQNNNIKNNHMDMGSLLRYLDQYNSSYIFKEIFGVEAKVNL